MKIREADNLTGATGTQRTGAKRTQPRKHRRTRLVRHALGLVCCVSLISACGSKTEGADTDASAGSGAASMAESTIETVAVVAGTDDTGPLETVALNNGSDVGETSTKRTATTKPSAIKHLPGSVSVAFDASRDTARPLQETVVPLTETTDVLSMKITGFSYRGVICGFTMQGEAPPSPVTIRQVIQTPTGTYDSGPIAVSWEKLDDQTVKAGEGQDETWNFSAAANTNRQGPGWVVSLGGVTADTGDPAATIPTDGGCELRSKDKVFGPKTGPVGYWAGFAVA